MSESPHPIEPLDAFPEGGQLLTSLADNIPAMTAYYEVGTYKCRFANRAYAAYNGCTPETIVGKTVREVIGEAAWLAIAPYVEKAQNGEAVEYTRETTLPDGSKRWIEVSLVPHFGADGRQLGSFVLHIDITRRQEKERLMLESEERLAKFSEASTEGIYFHQDGVYTDVNPAMANMLGYTREELIGRRAIEFVAEDYRKTVSDYMAAQREDVYEAVAICRDGTRLPVELIAKTLHRNGQVYRLGIFRDIRERKAAEARINFLAHHDVLTGLPNRRLLLERLDSLLALARRHQNHLAVLFIDLDHFKTVNDSLGHHAGDLLLAEVAARIQGAVREADVVARQGGDEFIVVLADLAQPEAAASVAVKLLVQVAAPFDIDGHAVSVAPSIGISVYPRDGATADELIQHADSAMYLSKQSGRGQYQFYAPELSIRAHDELSKEAALREAVRQGSFELHYQPQIDVNGERITGIEALVRWRRADGVLVAPNDFIAFAEERGLIGAIGRWVLSEACRQNKAWQDAGLPRVPIAVNVSPVQFKTGNLVADVERVLRQTGLEGRYLEVELTEGALMSDSATVTGKFATLRNLGVKLSIDDFGTGYSSLGYLKRYRIDKLKIDRTFVRDIETDVDDLAIALAIVQMGRTLKLTVLAEGVENEAQLDMLRAQGCHEFQGFLLSKALPADEAGELLRRYPHDDLVATQRMRAIRAR
jgi:diguanylate cyclase (GGDEF)-like protein/PAS domain S-box-containing protein